MHSIVFFFNAFMHTKDYKIFRAASRWLLPNEDVSTMQLHILVSVNRTDRWAFFVRIHATSLLPV